VGIWPFQWKERDMMSKKIGRPSTFDSIDKHHFENYCSLQCTLEEIAVMFDVSEDTLDRWCKKTYKGQTFAEVFAKKRLKGHVSLRSMNWRAIKDGNITMQIFYCKNYLGMKDKIEADIHDSRETVVRIAFDPQKIVKK
jgi:hypothetical protein